MNPTRCLIVSPFFFPEEISTGKYNTALAQALAEKGAEVEVVASHPLYPTWEPVYSNHQLPGMVIRRGGAWLRYPRSLLLRRVVFELWFAIYACWELWRRPGRWDVIITVSPPSLFSLLITWVLPRTARRIGILHDLQGVLGLSRGGAVKRLLYRWVRAVEGRAFRSCESLIVLSNAMKTRAVTEYDLAPEKIFVVYPFVTVRRDQAVGRNLVQVLPENFRHVVYSGALGSKQNPVALVELFRAAAHEVPDTQFHIFSRGPIYDEILARHNRTPTPGVYLHDLVPEGDLEELYSRSAVQVLPQLEDTEDACLPSKLPNILAMGCTILAICGPKTELAQILQRSNCGVAAHSWEINSCIRKLTDALDQARLQSSQERQKLVSDLLLSEFSLPKLVEPILRSAASVHPADHRRSLRAPAHF